MQVTTQSIEYGSIYLGLGTACPRLSWTSLGGPGESQRAYEVEADIQGNTLTTGRVETDQSTWVPWPFVPMASRQRFSWRVRVWGKDPQPGPWSKNQVADIGLLNLSDWTAQWAILDRCPPSPDPSTSVRPAVRGRIEFHLPQEVEAVRLYLTGHGVYIAELNGHPVNDDLLSPGWTDYQRRLVYRCVDVSGLVHTGINALGVTVADGWYRGRLGFRGGVQDTYGDDLSILAQLEALIDGEWVSLLEPQNWKKSSSSITRSALYEGETWEAACEEHEWSTPGFDDRTWVSAEILPISAFQGKPVAAELPPVRVTETKAPLTMQYRPGGTLRLDFGQNLVGRLAATIVARTDTSVVMHHAEVLENDELATRPLRRAKAEDVIHLTAGDRVTFAPWFTTHGFRYADISADPDSIEFEAVNAEVIHTDFERTGWFECSDPLLNRLHENTVWSTRGNFVSLPTDCPQRDERLGWTGDIQVFAPTARYLFDCSGLLSNWLEDLTWAQRDLGTVPNYVPWVSLGFPLGPTAAWGDAAVIVPWVLYECTGDLGLLERQFESMCTWVDQIDGLTKGTGLWNSGYQLGDWLDPEAPPNKPDLARTDRYLVATAYHSYSARLLSKAAGVLGRKEDQTRYSQIAKRAQRAFQHEWVSPSGRVVCDTPTALTLSIALNLLTDPAQLSVAGQRLAHTLWETGYHLKTGFVGTPLICDALVSTGNPDEAYHLLMSKDCPSWLYPVTMGATTIWERWDALLPDGSLNPGDMTSFNHYALGAVCDFLHRIVAGLSPAEPGYRRVRIAPIPGGGLTWAKTSHRTPYGLVSVAWERVGQEFVLHIELPTGVGAQVLMPGGGSYSLTGHGQFEFHGKCRAAEEDPEPPQRFNIHDPSRSAWAM